VLRRSKQTRFIVCERRQSRRAQSAMRERPRSRLRASAIGHPYAPPMDLLPHARS
jgi:hypothetical protein